jgi:signal transduction histidine kinase
MDADWITSPSARRVQQHAGDSRPAWLWSQDGQLLLWQNDAAKLFLAKLKKHGLKLTQPAVPIKGQIARNIRLGSVGRTSLARIQFLAGDKPASSTCATTPLTWQDGQAVLLVVGVDPIADDILAAASEATEPVAALDDAPIARAAEDMADDLDTETPAEAVEPEDAPQQDEPPVAAADDIPAAASKAAEPVAAQDDAPVARAAEDMAEDLDAETPAEAVEPEDAPQQDEKPVAAVSEATAYAQELANWREAEHDGTAAATDPADAAAPVSRLSQLVDRLAADEALFTPLTSADDAPPEMHQPAQPEEQAPEVSDAEADLGDLARLDGGEEQAAEPQPAKPADDVQRLTEALAALTPKPEADPEAVERVSRYNFDELARILTDRVSEPAPAAPQPPPPKPVTEPARTGALINLGGETLVLNRLPLGILVFRDQQVLFANRAITEMVGYDSVENLRAAGLGAVFPAVGPGGEDGAGPVNHLVQRDGTLVPVTARLQSISWQGRPALMLSASTTEVRTGHEAAVTAFAHASADMRGDGFFEASRTGIISAITQRGTSLLNADGMLEGKALSTLVSGADVPNLREFLERPARFAETERPSLIMRSLAGNADIALFAQGQAGVVSGYFGFVRGRETAPARIAPSSDAEPALLARISRGVRRPLNTIIGFADLIRSEAFGAEGNERYEGYARDIAVAGQEIAALVDELDDYARLRDGRYLPQRASIDLTSLLESCVVRIRKQANGARVIVRSAISERLPRVTADRASLAQAVLNLLASAIDQTPTGGGVVISAQREDDGSIAIHVRDSSNNAVDMAERFVVFRDGVGRDGQMMVPVRSSIGLALTRSLLAVNAFSLSVDPAGEQGMLFTLVVPADLVEADANPDVAE